MTVQQVGTLLNSFDSQWIGIIHQVAPKFLSGYVDETIRNRILLAMMRKRGRIVLNGGGSYTCVWNVKFQQPTPMSTGDGGTLEFSRQTHMRQMALNWRGYVVTDMMSEMEYLQTRGNNQIYNRYGQMLPALMEAITDHFGGELFLDGEATGRSNCIHGIESFLGAGSCTASDLVAAPSDSYGGLSTVLGSEGGSWSTSLAAGLRPNASLANDWPHGKGSTNYDFVAPKLINYSSTRWGTGSTEWENNCERAIRQGMIWGNNTGGNASKPSVILLSGDLYGGYLNHQGAKQRLIIPHKGSQDLGFNEAINQEGTAIMYDYEVSPQTGYGFNVDNMELVSLDNVLFGYRGPEWAMTNRAYLMYVGFWGNARYRPKHFMKFKNFA